MPRFFIKIKIRVGYVNLPSTNTFILKIQILNRKWVKILR